MLKRLALALAALAVLAAIGVFLASSRPGAAASPPAAPAEAAPSVPGGRPTARTAVSPGHAREGAGAGTGPGAAAPEAADEVEATGTVVGRAFDFRGRPLARSVVTLSRAGGAPWPARTHTDADGHYEIEVPAGPWSVGLQGRGVVETPDGSGGDGDVRYDPVPPVTMRCGDVVVPAGGTVRFDLRMRGERALGGVLRLTHEGEDGFGLVVELREASTLSLVARTTVLYLEPDDPGRFRIAGLVPDVYVLRIALDTVEDPGSVHLEEVVDLTAGDVDLGLREYTFADFPR